ncbi:MAG TPA: hypothetical protein DEO86_08550 [Colwellia sp.]|nr:hypothetical protein [Colwellia sp.]
MTQEKAEALGWTFNADGTTVETETIIDQLATEWINEERTEMSAGIELQNLADMPYSSAITLLTAARKRLINIKMQEELQDQENELDNAQWERDYEAGASL